MSIFELSALGAALCWAFNGLIAATPSQALGAVRFNQLRMSMVFVMLSVFVAWQGTWDTINFSWSAIIVLSGFVGIFLGDTALFITLNRLGPRRTAILFAMNAPISAFLAWLFLGESLNHQTAAGIVLTVVGVVLAITFGKRKSQTHHWESVKGSIWVGVLLGVIAALCQAIGSLVARPILEGGADPVAVSAARIGVAALSLSALTYIRGGFSGRLERPSGANVALTALSGFIGMALGMTFVMFALVGAKVGIVSTLAATTPALLLPLLWIRTREVPAAGAWGGAGLVCVGCGLIFLF